MSNPNSRHVVKRESGWAVVAPDAKRASAVTNTQREPISRAKTIVGNAGGGEVSIHGADGKIRAADTVKPGNDPHSSQG